eukprot:1010128-Heterocapsa_arctica.AAC.1
MVARSSPSTSQPSSASLLRARRQRRGALGAPQSAPATAGAGPGARFDAANVEVQPVDRSRLP